MQAPKNRMGFALWPLVGGLLLVAACAPITSEEHARRLRIAVAHVDATQKLVTIDTPRDGRVLVEAFPAIPYGSPGALMRANPGCCFVGIQPSDAPIPCRRPGFETYTVNYVVKYRDRHSDIGSKKIERRIGVDRRGRICEGGE